MDFELSHFAVLPLKLISQPLNELLLMRGLGGVQCLRLIALSFPPPGGGFVPGTPFDFHRIPLLSLPKTFQSAF